MQRNLRNERQSQCRKRQDHRHTERRVQEVAKLAFVSRIGRLVDVQRMRYMVLALVAKEVDITMTVKRRDGERRQEYRQQQCRKNMSSLLSLHFLEAQR